MLGHCVMLDQTHPIQLFSYASEDSVKWLYLEKLISSLLLSITMVFASHACFRGSGTSKTRAMRRMTASGTL